MNFLYKYINKVEKQLLTHPWMSLIILSGLFFILILIWGIIYDKSLFSEFLITVSNSNSYSMAKDFKKIIEDNSKLIYVFFGAGGIQVFFVINNYKDVRTSENLKDLEIYRLLMRFAISMSVYNAIYYFWLAAYHYLNVFSLYFEIFNFSIFLSTLIINLNFYIVLMRDLTKRYIH